VKQNEGFINVYSEPGVGTIFKIFLPREMSGTERTGQATPAIRGAQGQETILLVEDVPDILTMTALMLERFGYRVLAAATPEEAIRIAGDQSGKIRLLISDVIMPGMNGRALAQSISSISPGIKVLFMSGYTDDVIAHHGVLDQGVHFIQKPFSMQSLAAKAREALDSD
ncbi:MAG: response regulator, partial [Deltaproteobacteria bacterium]|nr:response regulator [Deltaproteobacteria bacterium]